MVESRRCDEQVLQRLVKDASDLVDKVLESLLAQPPSALAAIPEPMAEQVRAASELSKAQRRALCGAAKPPAASSAAGTAFLSLRHLLRASVWLPPALEYANGLRMSGRPGDSLRIWADAVASTREVLPSFPHDVAMTLDKAFAAVEAGRSEEELKEFLADSLRVVDNSLGGGLAAWKLVASQAAPRRAQSLVADLAAAATAAASSYSTLAAAGEEAPAGMVHRGGAELRPAHGNIQILVENGRLQVIIPEVDDPAALSVELSARELRLDGEVLALPHAVDADQAETRFSRRRREVTLLATCAS